MDDSPLAPGANFELPFVLHANKLGEQELCLLFTFREVRNVSPGYCPLQPVEPPFIGRWPCFSLRQDSTFVRSPPPTLSVVSI